MTTATRPASATATEPKELFEQFTTKAIEGLSLWADANQRVLRQLVDLSTATAAESVRVQAEFQSSALQALRTSQEYILTQQTRFTDLPKDPVGTYQKGVVDGVDGAQRAFKLLEASAETITKSAERLQQSAEQASKGIQSTFATLGSQLRTLYAPSEQ